MNAIRIVWPTGFVEARANPHKGNLTTLGKQQARAIGKHLGFKQS